MKEQSATIIQGRVRFGDPVPASKLKYEPEGTSWRCNGFLADGAVTLLSALPKAGKTTLLAYLISRLGSGDEFCGRATKASDIVYATEESQQRWAARCRQFGIGDHARFLCQPFLRKPTLADWSAWLDHLGECLSREPAAVLVLDTLSSLWPVRDENSAGEVGEALMPLRSLTQTHGCALFLVHHLRMGDGAEATGARGSGALVAFVDIALELRRYNRDSHHDRRRVIKGVGRYDEVPSELVIQLAENAGGYQACGDREAVQSHDLRGSILDVLPEQPPGLTTDQIAEQVKVARKKLLAELAIGIERADWQRQGSGKSGSPYSYFLRAPHDTVGFRSDPQTGGTGTDRNGQGESEVIEI